MYNLSFQGDDTCCTINDKNPVNFTSTPTPVSNSVTPKVQFNTHQIKAKDDTKIYDPYCYGNEENATSFWGIVGHLIVISLGPTLLTIPATFIDTGYVMGFLGTIVTVLLYAYCMRTIIRSEYELCKRSKQPNMSYMEMVEKAFDCGPAQLQWCAKYVQIIVYVVFLCVWIGGNSIIFLLAGQNLKNAYDYFFETKINENVFKLYLVLPLMALCWIPNLKLLVPLSTFTNIINVICITLIFYYDFIDIPELSTRKMVGRWTSLPMLIGVQLFSINATCLMIPLKNEMQFPKKFKSKFGVITTAYVPVCVIYSVFGLLCYIKYGDQSKDSVILNLPPTTFNKIMVGLYGIGNCCFYPLVAYASFDIIWNNMLKGSTEKIKRPLIWEYICRTLISISSIIFAYGVPNLNLFLAFTGTVGTSIDSLIVPALTEMLIHYKKGKYFLYIKDCLIIIFASFLIVMGTTDCIEQLIKTYQ